MIIFIKKSITLHKKRIRRNACQTTNVTAHTGLKFSLPGRKILEKIYF